MEDIKFKDITELYERLLPALRTKRNELLREKFLMSELDIWNYLKDTMWDSSEDLKLHDMAHHILNFNVEEYIMYKRKKLGESDE